MLVPNFKNVYPDNNTIKDQPMAKSGNDTTVQRRQTKTDTRNQEHDSPFFLSEMIAKLKRTHRNP